MELIETLREEGEASLRPESEDDLWKLDNLLDPGITAGKKTRRTKIDSSEKKTVYLEIEVEKTELSNGRLRLTGEIVKGAEGIELGYHSFNLEPGDRIDLKGLEKETIEELVEASQTVSGKILVCVADRDRVDCFKVSESGVDRKASFDTSSPGKMYDSGSGKLGEAVSGIERIASEFDSVVIAGPGDRKDEIADRLEIDVHTADTSVTGLTGLQEALKRGALRDVVQSSRIQRETREMEEFFQRLNEDDRATLGNIEELAEQGAVEKLLVTPKASREHGETVEKVQQMGGEIQEIHTDHEPGERLEKLGGLAALLRYSP